MLRLTAAVLLTLNSLLAGARTQQGHAPTTRGGERVERSYSGTKRHGSCSSEKFLLTVGPTQIVVTEVILSVAEKEAGGIVRLVIAHPDEIEPVLERKVALGSGDAVAIPTPPLEADIDYQVTASVICDAEFPSKNNTAVLEYRPNNS